MRHDKLVRDRIPELIRKRGATATVHRADDAEYRYRLKQKLCEEAEEFFRDETPEEIADLLEVVVAIASERGWNLNDLERTRAKKAAERGGFYGRIVLDESAG